MLVENGASRYHVQRLVAQTAAYRLYLCSQNGEERGALLQIATDEGRNGELDRAAYTLDMLFAHAQELEARFERVKKDPTAMLKYELCFPELVESFVDPNQGNRRVNILRFRKVKDPRQMVPLVNIVKQDRRRVDLRTSVWIMGRLLKLLGFAHGLGITVNKLTPGNILIYPKRHYVVVFNWADATRSPDGIVQTAEARQEIKEAARSVLFVLGQTSDGTVPNDGTDEFAPYTDHLLELAREGAYSAESAHDDFYKFVDGLWPRGYYPFTSMPLQ
jgi:hypothetical protein